mgnify:CR=1 FL=1
MKTLIASLILVSSLAQAEVYWHPEASSVIATAPDKVKICQWWPSPISFQPEVWQCEDVWVGGARYPMELDLESTGPVKVFAKWAYVRDPKGNLVPMQPAVED